MIYINWFHQNLPRILSIFSFIINPIFIYLVVTKTKSQVGSYKYLLIIFSIFDILYSISEVLTPFAVHGHKKGFAVFISDGIFFGDPELGEKAMSTRCGFISASYALLIIHFVYRYLAIFR
uniref:G_PROTEIN_RECEP_F1_2 domain-containing protein n=1 Tax=Caenorhabditis tropicalis TaxID=1561998 RepID=A0A1I7TYH5_9PELO